MDSLRGCVGSRGILFNERRGLIVRIDEGFDVWILLLRVLLWVF